MASLKDELHHCLQETRQALLSRLEGLSEYDLRRPMTPTGTNLLGLVKHLAGLEYIYLGDTFGRPAADSLPGDDDGSALRDADMWATPDESSADIIAVYQRACAHADLTIAELGLDAPGSVAHWDRRERQTTLGAVLVMMVWETAQHAGHADIIRELIDGTAGTDHDQVHTESGWGAYLDQVRAAADSFIGR